MSQVNKVLLGQIVDDPLEQMPDGLTMKFFPTAFLPQPDLKRSALLDWDFFDGALLALHFGSANNQSVLGSAILVAPGIALCARHVVEPFVQAIQRKEIGFICSAISKSGVMFWRIVEVTLSRQTDIAILALRFAARMPKSNEFTLAGISTRMPRIGELMTIAGFVAGKMQFQSQLPSPNSIEGNICVATGKVSQQFELKRDSHMLPWPTVEVDCANLGGMSGGPAFDNRGMLVGIVSSGFDEGPVFVSLIWPALAIKVQPEWPMGYYQGPVSITEIDAAVCHIDRREAVSLEQDQSTGWPKIVYQKW
jgi:hypothetical protein